MAGLLLEWEQRLGVQNPPATDQGFFDLGLDGPAGMWFLGGAEAVGPQLDVLQFVIRVSDSDGVVAKDTKSVHQRCRQLGHGLVEFCDGTCEMVAAKEELNHAYVKLG